MSPVTKTPEKKNSSGVGVPVQKVWMSFPVVALVSAAAFAQQPPTPGSVQDTVRDRPVAPTVAPPLIQPPAPGQQADPNAPKFAVSAISITGNSVISTEELQTAIKPVLAPQMNLADLNRVAETITEYYRNRGYRLARAVVVAQRVENGVVRIEVLEGKLGKINIHWQPALRQRIHREAPRRPVRQRGHPVFAGAQPAVAQRHAGVQRHLGAAAGLAIRHHRP